MAASDQHYINLLTSRLLDRAPAGRLSLFVADEWHELQGDPEHVGMYTLANNAASTIYRTYQTPRREILVNTTDRRVWVTGRSIFEVTDTEIKTTQKVLLTYERNQLVLLFNYSAFAYKFSKNCTLTFKKPHHRHDPKLFNTIIQIGSGNLMLHAVVLHYVKGSNKINKVYFGCEGDKAMFEILYAGASSAI